MTGLRTSVLVLGAALIGLYGPGGRPALADVVSLADLVASGGSITVGNEVFDHFSYTATGEMPGAENIRVTPIIDARGNAGLRFIGGFTDASDPSNVQQASASVLSYRVLSLADPIAFAHLAGAPTGTGPGNGTLSATETLTSGLNAQQGSIYTATDHGQSSTSLDATIPLAPSASSATVNTGIFALNMGGFSILPYLDQTFGTGAADPPGVSVTVDPPAGPLAIPEPGAASLLGLGFIGLLAARWHQRRHHHRRQP